MTMILLQMTRLAVVGASENATVEDFDADGEPIIRGDPVWRERGEIFLADPETARALIARGAAEKARLSGKLLTTAEATLDAAGPLAAARAGLAVPGIRVWHAQAGADGYTRPGSASLGVTRGGFDAAFGSAEEVEAHWAASPASTALFSFMTEHGFRRAYRWHDGGLLEIHTEIHTVGRE